jgi:hypothetical protein
MEFADNSAEIREGNLRLVIRAVGAPDKNSVDASDDEV